MLLNCVCLVIARMLDARPVMVGRVGWGGDDDVRWTCTHAGCCATVFVLSLHTCWMLRNCVCLVIAHMLDATPVMGWLGWCGAGWGWWRLLNLHTCWMLLGCVCLVIARMLDARPVMGWVGWNLHTCWMLSLSLSFSLYGTGRSLSALWACMLDAAQLCLSCHCTHAGCYSTAFVLSLHACWMLGLSWGGYRGGDDDVRWTCTHAGCCATVFVLSLHTCWMLRNCVWRNMFGRFCSEWTRLNLLETLGKFTQKGNNPRRWWQNDVFFRRMVPITHEFQAKRLCEDTNPWEKWDEINIWTNTP